MILQLRCREKQQREFEAKCQSYVDTIEGEFRTSFSRGSKSIDIEDEYHRGISKSMFECISKKSYEKYGFDVVYVPSVNDGWGEWSDPYVRIYYKE